jgi:hypothetical protein
VERAGFLWVRSEGRGDQTVPSERFASCSDAQTSGLLPRVALAHPDRATPSPFQARNPKRPRRAPPPSLDETALGRSGEEWALRGGCSRFKFALAVPIQTPCNIATSPRPSQVTPAGPHALVALTPRLRPRPPTRPRPSNPRALRPASGSRATG